MWGEGCARNPAEGSFFEVLTERHGGTNGAKSAIFPQKRRGLDQIHGRFKIEKVNRMAGLAQKRRRAGGWELWDELGGVFHERAVRLDSFFWAVYSNCAPEEGYFLQGER